MKSYSCGTLLAFGLLASTYFSMAAPAVPVSGSLAWRGPEQNGTSPEKNLPDQIRVEEALWTADFPGGSTAVVGNGKLYIVGYLGSDADLQEGIACFDAETGKKEWQRLFNDYLSDIIYSRYASSAPAIDPETGNVYFQGTQGLLAGFSPDGKLLWQRSLMEEYGRLTFPNGRTATPVVDRDLVIAHGITANWGAQGPGADRFYAFDKNTGALVWSSSPGDRPKDSSFSYPFLGWQDGKRVFYATTGDGSVVCANARTGEPIWRVPLAKAGINASVLVYKNELAIAVYGTPYEPGQMVALKIPHVAPTSPTNAPVIVERPQVEVWSNPISTSTSSPILVGDRIYVVAEKGDLCAVDVQTGKTAWTLKLGIEQRNSSPLFADGKLFVPMLEDPSTKSDAGGEAGTSGAFYIVQPGAAEGKILSQVTLQGRCFGSPAVHNGRIYIQTTSKLYCFGAKGARTAPAPAALAGWPKPGPATQLQIIPSELLLQPGQAQAFRVRKLDANGLTVEELKDSRAVKWSHYVPPTARVRSAMKARFDDQGRILAENEPVASAGAFQASLGELKGVIRGRVLPGAPLEEKFESFTLDQKDESDSAAFAYPPLPWIGARFKFQVREVNGEKVLAKTIDNRFFQRATVFLGDPEMKNYTLEADLMSDGNRRKMSDVGVINQRYAIVLKGNEQKLEINSNLERLRVPAAQDPPNFRWKPNVWYRLKTRVDRKADGSGIIRAKAWPRGEAEPEAWTIEVEHATAHQNGAPGLYGFSPQDMRVYIDNIILTENSK